LAWSISNERRLGMGKILTFNKLIFLFTRRFSLLIKEFVFGLILVVLLSSCTSKPTPIPDFVTAEEYQVYHDLLLENPDMWNVPPDAQHMVIFDQSFVRPEPQTVSSLLQNKTGVSEKLISNFLEANQMSAFF